MRSHVATVALLAAALIGSGASAQVSIPAARLPRTHAELAQELRDEASRVATVALSPTFAAVANPEVSGRIGLAPDQIELAHRLEGLTRDIIRYWLTRGIDAAPPPMRELADRLGEPGRRSRARIVGHADAVAIQGILSSSQAQPLLRLTRGTTPPILPGRTGPPRPVPGIDQMTVEELVGGLRAAEWYRSPGSRAGLVMGALLGSPHYRERFPKGLNDPDPRWQASARNNVPRANLTPEQTDLCERLNGLLGDVLAGTARDLDKRPLPSRSALVQRLAGAERLRESLFAHGEAIALEGITAPAQANQCLAAVWERLGMRALLDPALVSRLRLSKWQRNQVASLFERKDSLAREARSLWPAIRQAGEQAGDGTAETLMRRAMLDRQHRERDEAVDALIFNLLDAGQARLLDSALHGVPPRQRANVKRGDASR